MVWCASAFSRPCAETTNLIIYEYSWLMGIVRSLVEVLDISRGFAIFFEPEFAIEIQCSSLVGI